MPENGIRLIKLQASLHTSLVQFQVIVVVAEHSLSGACQQILTLFRQVIFMN